MKEFIFKNWYYIILACLAIASFTASMIFASRRGKKTNFLDTVKEALLEQIPYWAIISEGMVSGADKKNNVLQLGIALARKLLGRDLSADENSFFVAFITDALEKILSAPQKKLEMSKISEKSKYTVK